MSKPANPDATDIHAPPAKIFGGTFAGQKDVDLTDPAVVAQLAEDILCGTKRRVTMVSYAETRALAQLAYASFFVVIAVGDMLTKSDAAAPKPEIRAALRRVASETRAFMGRFDR